VPTITILSDFTRAFDPDAGHDKADYFRLRHHWWAEFATDAGWNLTVRDLGPLRDDPALLGKPDVCFIDMPLVPPDDYRSLWAACCRELPPERIRDHPDDVDAVLSLAGAYRSLDGKHFAKVRTGYVPVSVDHAEQLTDPGDVERLLGARIEEAISDAGLELGRGLFIRGYFASLRSQLPSSFFAATRSQLFATCARVARGLRRRPTLGGFAIREYLELEQVQLKAGLFPLEIRLSFVGGRCVSASYHGPYETLDPADRAMLAERLLDPTLRRAAETVAGELEGAALPRNFVADVFFRRGTVQPWLNEFNPLYSSGYHVPLARVWVQASLATALAEQVGYPRPAEEWLRRVTERLSGEKQSESGAVLWLASAKNR
jgi:hypothetical protein